MLNIFHKKHTSRLAQLLRDRILDRVCRARNHLFFHFRLRFLPRETLVFEFITNNDVHKVNKMMKLVSFKNSENINNGKLINIKTLSNNTHKTSQKAAPDCLGIRLRV